MNSWYSASAIPRVAPVGIHQPAQKGTEAVSLRRPMFGVIYGLILAVATLAGIEFLSSFYAPSWPARALRSVPPANPVTATTKPFSDQPWIADPYNSWGMRGFGADGGQAGGRCAACRVRGRQFRRIGFHALVASGRRRALRVAETGGKIEAINLGVSGTDPRSYYYRIRDVALKLSPDAILLFIYAGNDFMASDKGYSTWPSLIDKSPGGSLLGTVMPRTNWLLVNRLRLSEFLRGQPAPAGESEMLYDDVARAARPSASTASSRMSRNTTSRPFRREDREILSRGDDRLWRPAEGTRASRNI